MPLYQQYKAHHFRTKALINRKLALIGKIVKNAGWVDVARNQFKTKGQEKLNESATGKSAPTVGMRSAFVRSKVIVMMLAYSGWLLGVKN